MADEVAFLEAGVARLDDAADAPAQHGGVQRLVSGQAGPHVGIDRHQHVLDLDLALGGVRGVDLDHGEVLDDGDAGGAADEVDLAAGGHVSRLP